MTELAKRYGDSLYELAAEENLVDQILEELQGAVGCLKADPEYLRLLGTPNIPKKERAALLGQAFDGQVHPYVVNFLKLLCDEGLLGEVGGCLQAYRSRFNKDRGIAEATAVCAAPLSGAERQKLLDKLSAMTGKTIDLTVKVDPSLLGGIRVDMDGTRLDGTLQRRLQSLRGDILGAVL